MILQCAADPVQLILREAVVLTQLDSLTPFALHMNMSRAEVIWINQHPQTKDQQNRRHSLISRNGLGLMARTLRMDQRFTAVAASTSARSLLAVKLALNAGRLM